MENRNIKQLQEFLPHEETLVAAYLKDIGKYKLLTRKEQKKYLLIKNTSREAFNKLFTHNLRLVVSITKKYVGKGLPILDLISEGNIGLRRAIEKFDPTLDTQLSTYATWWIRQKMIRAIENQVNTIRFPVHISNLVKQVNSFINKHYALTGQHATPKDISKEFGMNIKHARDILTQLEYQCSPLDELKHSAYYRPEIKDFLLKNKISDLLSILDEREIRIIKKRYGMDNGIPMTLEKISVEEKLSRERIRQIQKECLNKLKEHIIRSG